jgi:hypothetical protein
MSTYKEYLNKIWYDPKSPIAFAGLKVFKRFVIKDNKYRIRNVRLQKWLQNHPSYSVRRKAPTQTIKIPRVNYQWHGDLMDLSNIKIPRVNYQWHGDLMDLSNIKVPRVNYQWHGDLMDLSNIKVPRVNYQWDGDLVNLSNIKVPRVNYQWDGDLMDLSNIKVPRVNYQWDGDLMDLSNTKEYNINVTVVLVVIDVFNIYAYLRPLKSKQKPNN